VVQFLVRRLLQSVFVIIGLSILIFMIARIVPGNPARMALGPRASQEAVDKLYSEMNLDKPITVQYIYWVKGVLKGDFGRSIFSKRPVIMDIKEFFPATMELILFSGIMMVAGAFALGLISVRFKDTWVDGTLRVLAYIGISIPPFVLGIIFLLLFGYLWRVIPVIGRLSPNITPPKTVTGMIVVDSLLEGNFTTAWNAIQHIFLPALALSAGSMLQEARILRSSMIDNMWREYISVSTGYGLPNKVIMGKYLLKPSSVSVITVIGLDFAALMGNAFLVEQMYSWPGLSRYGINSMLTKDLNPISAVIIIIGLLFLTVNIIIDLIIAYIDPRIKLGDT
jgi:peptide/nickel transport system permease protein